MSATVGRISHGSSRESSSRRARAGSRAIATTPPTTSSHATIENTVDP